MACMVVESGIALAFPAGASPVVGLTESPVVVSPVASLVESSSSVDLKVTLESHRSPSADEGERQERW